MRILEANKAEIVNAVVVGVIGTVLILALYAGINYIDHEAQEAAAKDAKETCNGKVKSVSTSLGGVSLECP